METTTQKEKEISHNKQTGVQKMNLMTSDAHYKHNETEKWRNAKNEIK